MLRAVLAVTATLLVTSPAAACFAYPDAALVSHSKLIARTATIVLVDVIGARVDHHDDVVVYTFQTRETLKGTAPATFTRRFELDGYRAPIVREDPVRDYDRHRDPWFWDWYGRTGVRGDCSIVPAFFAGRRYLVFDTAPYHTKSFEEITHDDDRWLAAVRTVIRSGGRMAGFSQTVFEWLRERAPVFLVEYDCPVADDFKRAVERVTHLVGDPALRSDDWNVKSYYEWGQRCTGGGRFLYAYYHDGGSTRLSVIDGHVDFSLVTTNVHFVGPTRVSLDEIRQTLR